MKLLFDQNLSPNLVTCLADTFPDSRHVCQLNLDRSQDQVVFDHARRQRFVLVTKEADFGELTVLLGFPPKVVWIRQIHNLEADPSKGVLTLF